MQGSNFRTSDPGLAVAWPLVEASILRCAPEPEPIPYLTPYQRSLREVCELERGGATLVRVREARSVVTRAQRDNAGRSYRIERKSSRVMIVERVR